MLVIYHSNQFAMSHGSYGSNLGSEILILVGAIRSRSWPNIGWTYGMILDVRLGRGLEKLENICCKRLKIF
jgi:hypothetical protein